MRRFLIAAMAVFLATGLARADDAGDAKDVVSAIFQPYTQGLEPSNRDSYYSDSLKQLFAKRAQAAAATGIGGKADVAASGAPEFDPFVNAQHYLLLDLSIGDAVIEGDHAMVPVSYKNFDHPSELVVSLLKTPDGWKVDDVASFGADQHWLLSWLLANDPWSAN